MLIKIDPTATLKTSGRSGLRDTLCRRPGLPRLPWRMRPAWSRDRAL